MRRSALGKGTSGIQALGLLLGGRWVVQRSGGVALGWMKYIEVPNLGACGDQTSAA